MKVYFDPILNKLRRNDLKEAIAYFNSMGIYALIEVANYSALPDPTTVHHHMYVALASQGTSWLPGSWGGNYYPEGYYYSDGTQWIYAKTPYQALQVTVDAGLVDNQFVSPLTFNNASKWNNYATLVGTETLSNKRITQRVTTITSSATPTPDSDTTDEYTITALAAAALLTNPTGTPTVGQALLVRIKDNGTARALTFDTLYRFSTDQPAPTTTVINKTIYLGFVYNFDDTKWDCLGWITNI